jgi:hypothetical protein
MTRSAKRAISLCAKFRPRVNGRISQAFSLSIWPNGLIWQNVSDYKALNYLRERDNPQPLPIGSAAFSSPMRRGF